MPRALGANAAEPACGCNHTTPGGARAARASRARAGLLIRSRGSRRRRRKADLDRDLAFGDRCRVRVDEKVVDRNGARAVRAADDDLRAGRERGNGSVACENAGVAAELAEQFQRFIHRTGAEVLERGREQMASLRSLDCTGSRGYRERLTASCALRPRFRGAMRARRRSTCRRGGRGRAAVRRPSSSAPRTPVCRTSTLPENASP